MTVHLFGAVSAPSCASFALRTVEAEDNQTEFLDKVCETIKENFYVDDCLKSVASTSDAVDLVKDLSALCQRGGFILTKWVSNNRTLLQSISEEQRAKDFKDLNLDRDKLPVERALGLQWCVENDTFNFKMDVAQKSCTRRGMLSISSSIYDPLGFLAPVLLPAKRMQQDLCRRKLGWDEPIPQTMLQKWKTWLSDLQMLSHFEVKRCIQPREFGPVSHA